jgi:predicted MFS family arabinose efflux permease
MGEAQQEWRQGWRAVLAAGIGYSTGFILFAYLSSLFIEPYTAEFGWSRGELGLAGAASACAALFAPSIGRFIDRFDVRHVLLVGITGYGLTTVALSQMTGQLWMLFGLMFLFVLFGLCTGSLSWTRVVSVAFARARGTALSVALSLVALTAAVMPPVTNWVIETQGWRTAWLVIGAVGVGFGLLAVAVLPARFSQPVPRDTAVTNLWDAARKPAFWCVVGGMFFVNIPSGGLLNNLAALITDKGISGAMAATLMSSFGLSVLIGRLIAGVCLDRYPAALVAGLFMALPALGCLLLLSDGAALAPLLVGIVLAGLSQGAESDVAPFVVARWFGLAAFGRVLGSVNVGLVMGTAAGTVLFGKVHDATGSYDLALWIGTGCFLLGSALFFGLRKPPVPIAYAVPAQA